MKITDIHARQILDSRGNPTIEADVTLADGSFGRAAVPSGASTGTHEALELRDEQQPYGGKGVLKAVANVNEPIRQALIGKDSAQSSVDTELIDLDGTPDKSSLGANAILAVSLAVAKANALSTKQPLFQHIQELAGISRIVLPVPMINIINGGAHAAGSTDIQEFMIVPVGADSFDHAVQMGSEVFHALRAVLAEKGYATTVGDEGGYAPHVTQGNTEALDLIVMAISKAGYTAGQDIVLALDVAASEFFTDNHYKLATEKKQLTTEEMIDWLDCLRKKYPLISIEDSLSEDDWAGWTKLTDRLGHDVQLVGDDLFVTNTKFLQRGIKEKAGNAILIKVNQIGTLTETIKAVQLAQAQKFHAIISHRSGETEDTTIAHLAVGLGTGQIKTGSVSRGERTAKYNELLRIEEALGSQADYPGLTAFYRG